MSAADDENAERAIEQWKIKKLIQKLESARGYDPIVQALIVHADCGY